MRHTYSSARRSSSRRSQVARVLAQQPSEAWPAAHGCGRDDRIRPGNRRSEVQAPVWSGLVVMLHPLPHHPLQVSTADDQDPVQALSATGTDLPLNVSVRLRCRDRSLDHPHALGKEHRVSRTGVLGVVVVNQEANRRTVQLPGQVPALLSYPRCIWIGRHREPNDRYSAPGPRLTSAVQEERRRALPERPS